MAYNPELLKELLGDKVAEMMDGTVEIIQSENKFFGNLKVGDTLSFKFKEKVPFVARQFVVTGNK